MRPSGTPALRKKERKSKLPSKQKVKRYNFEKAHFILDEMIMGGEIMETSNRVIVQNVVNYDRHEEDEQNAIS